MSAAPERCLVAALAAALFAAAPALAQQPGPGAAADVPPVTDAAAAAAPDVPPVAAAAPRNLFDLGWDSGKPLSIHSDELEYVQGEGSRHLFFRSHVQVDQDGMTITSDRLEAIYPPKGSQPSRLIAEGDVHLTKDDRVVRCARATYDRTRNFLTCEGSAEFQQGQNRVSGDVIEVDNGANLVHVRGAAAVSLEAGLLKQGGESHP